MYHSSVGGLQNSQSSSFSCAINGSEKTERSDVHSEEVGQNRLTFGGSDIPSEEAVLFVVPYCSSGFKSFLVWAKQAGLALLAKTPCILALLGDMAFVNRSEWT